MTTLVAKLQERIPPLVVTVMVMAEETNEGPEPLGAVFSMVPPSSPIVAPELAVICEEPGKDNLAPDLIVIVLVVSATAAPLSETPLPRWSFRLCLRWKEKSS